MSSINLLSLIVFCLIIWSPVCAFQLRNNGNHFRRNINRINMMFGMKKESASGGKVVITVEGKTIESTEKNVNLRKELIKNNIDVYPLKAKITGNCGGAGICGTCAVKVLSGAQNINPPSKNEQNTLKGKPADFRLSCCSRVSGPISIKTKP